MDVLETSLRSIQKEGLVWGSSQLKDLAYGIKMLQINVVVENDKVSTDELQTEIEEDYEDYVGWVEQVRVLLKSIYRSRWLTLRQKMQKL